MNWWELWYPRTPTSNELIGGDMFCSLTVCQALQEREGEVLKIICILLS